MTTKTPTDTKQIILLAAAEESYSQAATVLQTVLKESMDLMTAGCHLSEDTASRLQTGLHLLEEAMGAHNRYMESLK